MRIIPFLLVVPLCAALGSTAEPLPPGDDFGAALTLRETTPLAAVVADPERFAGRSVLVRGRVSDVCQKKGCWTILRDGEAHVRVRFEDYGFFLPKDSLGSDAWAQGVVSVVTLSEDEARHYEAESRGGDPDRIQGPQRRVHFTASGVRLVRRNR
ncbi:MAG: DUF4920 domain-containing protein [Proteobacteria bacterium]|nr:DUF4920 domain-containing protein [Pseudomonadota bacterium]